MKWHCNKLAAPALALLMLTGCFDDSNEVVVTPPTEVVPDPDAPTDPDIPPVPLPESLDQCQLTDGSLTCQQPVTSLAALADIPGLTAISLNDLNQEKIETLPVLPEVTAIQLSYSTLSSIDLLNTFPGLTSLQLDNVDLAESTAYSYRTTLSLGDQLVQMTGLETLVITNSDQLIGQFSQFPDLSQHTHLHTLDLSNNPNLFKGSAEKVLPLFTAISQLSKLTSLSLENTGLALDDNAPLQLSLSEKDLMTLKLAFNDSTLFANDRELLNTIVAMKNLEVLTVSYLNDSDHGAYSLANWPKLNSLGLNDSATLLDQQSALLNDILTRPWQMLDLAGNRLTLSAVSLANLQPKTIRALDLSGNTVDQDTPGNGQTFPELIASFTNLEVLNLSSNELTSLSLGAMPKLHTLDLSNNQLTDTSLSLGAMPKLHTLDLSNNQLTDFAPGEGQMPVLQTLDLVGNELTSFSAGTIPTLLTLDLRLNQFTTLAFTEGQMPVLRSLDLSFNFQLAQFAPLSFPKLETLSLTNHSLSHFAIGEMPALKILDLSYGQLTHFTSDHLPALEVLDLEGNQLTQFDSSDMPTLQNLRLRTNKVTTFTTTGNPSLEVLHLGSNSLSEFNSVTLPKLQSLNLEHNQLTGLTVTEGQLPEMMTLKVNVNREFDSLVLSDDQRHNGTRVEAVGTAFTEAQKEQLEADYPTITFKYSFGAERQHNLLP